MKTTVVHKRDNHDVYIGRGSDWGNPFVTGINGDRTSVIAQYHNWLLNRPELLARIKTELKGKRLGCFCTPKPCHGDILATIADEP